MVGTEFCYQNTIVMVIRSDTKIGSGVIVGHFPSKILISR